ncbi:MAG: terminase large subunit [Oscillospiraceae bacterium]|nr:terminase large subunit [Oscillospiraceae bacterium]
MEREDLELHTKEPDFVIGIIEKLVVHKQGEDINGESLVNKPLKLQPWQIFIVYNAVGFYYRGSGERRYKEAFIMVPRKSGKTLFVAALAFGLAMLQRKSGAKIYIVAAALKQACEAFQDIVYTLQYRGIIEDFRKRDNNNEHSLRYEFYDDDGAPCGSIDIEALAANPDAQDSFNCNIAIADEIHAFKKAAQYNRFKEAMKAYTNKLMIGITTAGDNVNSFCYRRMEYGIKVLNGIVKDDSLFCFISRADQSESGDVDYLSPEQHEKANPSYGVTIRPEDMRKEALQAQNDPQQRKDFLSRSLNIYTAAVKAWFNIDEFKASDAKYNWTLEELARLPIKWYGGADLSRMYDLTAVALYGQYKGVDIIIPHGFFPVAQAAQKADEDNIPLFGWEEDGWLTICNNPTVNISDVVKWFTGMREKGFKIRQVGHDRKFAGEEYFPAMKKAGFNIIDQPQYYYLKSQGFRHIEKAAKDGLLYYLHSEAYEYCVANVHAVEKTDDAVQYDKVLPDLRIDLFDASVFACVRMAEDMEHAKKAKSWFGEN